jgi:hypothetical protein
MHRMGSFLDEIWAEQGSITAFRKIDLILPAATYLPLAHWRKNFLFFGAKDKKLLLATGGEFPAALEREKSRPVFCIAPVYGGVGFKVCPCSTRHPFSRHFRYVPEGCTLLHTGRVTDKRSFLVERFTFPIPRSLAMDLTFKGEVPPECLKTSPA